MIDPIAPIPPRRSPVALRSSLATRFHPPRGALVRWAGSLAAWLAAYGLTLLLADWVQRGVFVFFWVAVLFAAWFGGLVPAIVVSLGAVVVVQYHFVPPAGLLPLNVADVLLFSIFLFAATLVSALASSVARAQRRADEYAGELAAYAEQLEQQAAELEQQSEESRELAAEAAAANRAKAEFLAAMSHELRTPLNAIGGYAELIELGVRGPVTPEQVEDLRRIRRSQRHLLGLISDILNFSRLDAGRMEFHLGDVALAPLLTEASAMIAPQAEARSLTCVIEPVAPALAVRADPERLRQILLNLLGNAVKFTPPGGRVNVSCTQRDGVVDVRVADTGPGIAPEQQQAIFEPFVQLDRRLTNNVDGAGLGLAISRQLAYHMGGGLDVESRPGEGSIFVLSLPAARGD